MHEHLTLQAGNSNVSQDHFIDAIVVPLIVGRHLINPLGFASVHIACEDSRRPAIVTRTHTRVPVCWVARTVIEEIEFWVIGVPTPGAATAGLPCLNIV
jgi:hypothetical protein